LSQTDLTGIVQNEPETTEVNPEGGGETAPSPDLVVSLESGGLPLIGGIGNTEGQTPPTAILLPQSESALGTVATLLTTSTTAEEDQAAFESSVAFTTLLVAAPSELNNAGEDQEAPAPAPATDAAPSRVAALSQFLANVPGALELTGQEFREELLRLGGRPLTAAALGAAVEVLQKHWPGLREGLGHTADLLLDLGNQAAAVLPSLAPAALPAVTQPVQDISQEVLRLGLPAVRTLRDLLGPHLPVSLVPAGVLRPGGQALDLNPGTEEDAALLGEVGHLAASLWEGLGDERVRWAALLLAISLTAGDAEARWRRQEMERG
jgi:hypothetical protein